MTDRDLRPIDTFTSAEVATLAGCTRQNVEHARKRGELESICIGGRHWFRDTDVAVWLMSRKRSA